MQKRAKKTTNQTRGQLDKHDFGKKLKNLGKKQKEREKKANQTRDQLDKHDFGKKLQKPRHMHKKTKKTRQKHKNNGKTTMQKEANKKQIRPVICIFLHCVFAPASFLHF